MAGEEEMHMVVLAHASRPALSLSLSLSHTLSFLCMLQLLAVTGSDDVGEDGRLSLIRRKAVGHGAFIEGPGCPGAVVAADAKDNRSCATRAMSMCSIFLTSVPSLSWQRIRIASRILIDLGREETITSRTLLLHQLVASGPRAIVDRLQDLAVRIPCLDAVVIPRLSLDKAGNKVRLREGRN
eukprot:COSAG06_NODE_3172_length_5736_cov_2.704985_5_plen_183_part_00